MKRGGDSKVLGQAASEALPAEVCLPVPSNPAERHVDLVGSLHAARGPAGGAVQAACATRRIHGFVYTIGNAQQAVVSNHAAGSHHHEALWHDVRSKLTVDMVTSLRRALLLQAPKQEVFNAIQNKDPTAVADKLNKASQSECPGARAGGARQLAPNCLADCTVLKFAECPDCQCQHCCAL